MLYNINGSDPTGFKFDMILAGSSKLFTDDLSNSYK